MLKKKEKNREKNEKKNHTNENNHSKLLCRGDYIPARYSIQLLIEYNDLS